jgi:hypothetical protein
MATLVHLTDERNLASIRKNGIKVGKRMQGIYCMPVLPDFFVTHQWLRELKRGGAKTFIGIYFKLPSDEMVYSGKYGEDHRKISLREAIGEIMTLPDPLGYELIVCNTIAPDQITLIKHLPQTIGWRFKPDSHGTKPCGCEFCQRGAIKGRRIMRRLDG